MRPKTITILCSPVVLVAAGFLFLRYLSLGGRLMPPTTEEFVALAKQYTPMVQAIYDYRAEHGVLPEELDELMPQYIPSILKEHDTGMGVDRVWIHADAPHTAIYYSFELGSEGWHVGGDMADNGHLGDVALPLPKQATTRPALNAEVLVRARIAEYDRRITSNPNDLHRHSEKIRYLLSLSRTAEARAASDAAAKADANWWWPQMAIARLADPAQRESSGRRFRAWADEHPSFNHYYYVARYCREVGQHGAALSALHQAVKHMPARTTSGNALAFDAAKYAYEQHEYELVLEITRVWVQMQVSGDVYAFKAAAELALGRFDEAQADADLVANGKTTQPVWARNIDKLRAAAGEKNRSFQYDPGADPVDKLFLGYN